MNKEQIEILDHTVKRAAYGLYCGDSGDMKELVKAGYMESAGFKGFCPDEFFRITKSGKEVLKDERNKESK